jgi:hypothetical protein
MNTFGYTDWCEANLVQWRGLQPAGFGASAASIAENQNPQAEACAN